MNAILSRLCANKAEPISTANSVIVGLGNPILTDDAVGLAVARCVHRRLADPQVALIEAAVGGIQLIEMLDGYDKAVIVDAIKTEGGHIGDHYLLDLEGSTRSSRRTGMTHEIGLLEGLELGRDVGMHMPDYLRVYGVEVADPLTFGTEMTDEVKAAVPIIAESILSAEYWDHTVG